jgi:hypothetical protein
MENKMKTVVEYVVLEEVDPKPLHPEDLDPNAERLYTNKRVKVEFEGKFSFDDVLSAVRQGRNDVAITSLNYISPGEEFTRDLIALMKTHNAKVKMGEQGEFFDGPDWAISVRLFVE